MMNSSADDQLANFLSSWIDANIVHPVEPVTDDVEALCRRFLTDAVASGITLDKVNERWPTLEKKVLAAVRQASAFFH